MPTAGKLSDLTTNLIARGGARLLRNRRLMRAPIWLYRARLGFLFGSRMLMLEHMGRKSGVRRYVVLEVIDPPTPGTYVVVSGFGERAQWFQNVRANSRVRVWTAGHSAAPAIARELPPHEADAALSAYTTRHPRAWERFKPVVENTLGTSIEDHDTALPMVGLHLDHPAR